MFDLPPTETLTRDRQGRTVDKTIAVDAFVCWRVPDAAAADRFIRTVGTPEQARRLLTPRLTGRLAAVISNLPLDDVIQVADAGDGRRPVGTTAPTDPRLERVGDDDPNVEPLPTAVLRDYGIELVDVRLRRFTFPEAVRAGIAERIRSERQRKVADYQSEGNREYTRIVSEAQRDAAKTVAEAKAKRQRIEGEGRRRGRRDPQRGPLEGPGVLRLPAEAGGVQGDAGRHARRAVCYRRRMSCSTCC